MDKIIPRVDIAFKKIFSVEENKDLFKETISKVTGLLDDKINRRLYIGD